MSASRCASRSDLLCSLNIRLRSQSESELHGGRRFCQRSASTTAQGRSLGALSPPRSARPKSNLRRPTLQSPSRPPLPGPTDSKRAEGQAVVVVPPPILHRVARGVRASSRAKSADKTLVACTSPALPPCPRVRSHSPRPDTHAMINRQLQVQAQGTLHQNPFGGNGLPRTPRRRRSRSQPPQPLQRDASGIEPLEDDRRCAQHDALVHKGLPPTPPRHPKLQSPLLPQHGMLVKAVRSPRNTSSFHRESINERATPWTPPQHTLRLPALGPHRNLLEDASSCLDQMNISGATSSHGRIVRSMEDATFIGDRAQCQYPMERGPTIASTHKSDQQTMATSTLTCTPMKSAGKQSPSRGERTATAMAPVSTWQSDSRPSTASVSDKSNKSVSPALSAASEALAAGASHLSEIPGAVEAGWREYEAGSGRIVYVNDRIYEEAGTLAKVVEKTRKMEERKAAGIHATGLRFSEVEEGLMSLIPCSFCNRKFNQQSIERHENVCRNKARERGIRL